VEGVDYIVLNQCKVGMVNQVGDINLPARKKIINADNRVAAGD
jgi:hypothetical protein